MKKILILVSAALLFAGCSKVVWEDDTPYITFSADDPQSFTMNFDNWDLGQFILDEGEFFEYSVGDGEWQRFTGTVSGIAFGGENGNLRLRGKSRRGTTYSDENDLSPTIIVMFSEDAVPVRCSGDIRTLVDYSDYRNADTRNAQFGYLFYGCNALVSVPDLPATELAEKCYDSMFSLCTSLEIAPELPATKLSNGCYSSMFSQCFSLKTAPELPASELSDECYQYMFYECTSLETAPELKAETLVDACYRSMFQFCSSLKDVKLYATDGFDSKNCIADFLLDSGPGTLYLKNEDVANKLTEHSNYSLTWQIKYLSE